MKKSLFLLLIFILGSTFVFANHVEPSAILKVAANFYTARAGLTQNIDQAALAPQIIYTRYEKDIAVFHAIQFINQPGYVIVAGDDKFTPIIGYSTSEAYPLNLADQPPAYVDWMNSIALDVLNAINNDGIANAHVSSNWDMLLNHPELQTDNTTTAVSPLTTTLWGQGCNYNNSCPATGGVHPDGPCNHALTGCVATAMSQVMKYWNFPPYGTGSNSYTDPANTNDPSYGVLSASFNVNYEWANMPDAPANTSTGTNLLMSHAGISVNMNYAYNTSGAWTYGSSDVANAFKDHFNYSNTAVDIKKADYTESAWNTVLTGELNASHPICYGNNNHAWVIDGYDDDYNGTGNMYYHMNWGWNGGSNGFSLLANAGTNQECIDNLYPSWMAPIAPTDVTASAGLFFYYIIVEWRWASNATHYKVYRSTINNSSTAVPVTSWQSGTAFSDYTAIPNQNYYYWVKSATSAAGANESAFSASAEGYTASPYSLTSTFLYYAGSTPYFYEFTNNNYWNVVAVRANLASDDWDIHMYPETDFTVSPSASSTLGNSYVDFVVIDGNNVTPDQHGIRVNRYSGSSASIIQFDGGTDQLNVGSNDNINWPTSNIVNGYDVYLTPGLYGVQLTVNSGTFDPGIAFFGSQGGTYSFSRSEATANSDYAGNGGDEAFTIIITTAGYYGIVVWSNNGNAGNFNINIAKAGTWTGAVDHNWHNAGNWSGGIVPNSGIDVTIPDVANRPWIYYSAAECNNLIVENGSGNYLRIYDQILTVNGNATIYGQIMQDNPDANAQLIVLGNISWESGSTAWTTDNTTMRIYGNWSFKPGSSVQLNTGAVMFFGTSISYLYIDEINSYFSTLGSYKTDGASVWFSSASTAQLGVTGVFYIHPNAAFVGNSSQDIVVAGNFYNNSHLNCYAGSFYFTGTDQTITMNPGDYFNNLVIFPYYSVTLNTDVTCNGGLTIMDGTLYAGTHNISVGGNWNNLLYPLGFEPGTGTVIFDGGNYHQYCSSEDFYNIIVNKASGGAFRMEGTNVSCQSYDWTAGAVDVLSGSFTAYYLADNGISGSYYVNPGGTINLYNNTGYVDLNGSIYIFGGDFNVYGGISESWWPYTANASITMSNGTLDFKNSGIYITNNSYSFSQNIIGGTIRSSGGFRVDRTEFTPTGGTVELYGPLDVSVQTTNGSNLNNLIINKSASSSSLYDLYINGSLEIMSGNLSTPSSDIYIKGNWTNNVGLSGFSCGTGTVRFVGALPSILYSNETFYNLTLNKTYAPFNGMQINPGLSINVAENLTITDGTMLVQDNAQLILNNLTITSGSGLNLAGTNTDVQLTGNWINNNTVVTSTEGFNCGPLSTVTFIGTNEQHMTSAAVEEQFNNLIINKPAGSFYPFKGLQVNLDFSLLSGTFSYGAYGLTHVFKGNFYVAPGTNWYNGQSTVTFSGNPLQDVFFTPANGFFYHVNVSKPTGSILRLTSGIISLNNGSLTVYSGILNLNGYFYRCTGNVTIAGGKITIPAGSWLEVGSGYTLQVQNSGTIELLGDPANNAKITHHFGYYNFDVENGGILSADNAIFEYMSTNGVHLQNGSIVDNTNSLNNCTFRNGQSGGTLLRIDNNQVFTVDNANFPTNTWSSNSNVWKSVDLGTVSFTNYTGDFAGEDFDNDIFNHINWVGMLNISGHLHYDNALATVLNNTKVYLKSGGIAIDSTTTDATGYYIFPTVAPGSYTLDGNCTKTWGGVNATDALLIMRHFVHYITLSGIRAAAADVDGTGYINTIDALMATKRFVNIISSFALGDWLFEQPVVTVTGSGPVTQEVIGICRADVDASYNPPVKHEPNINFIEENQVELTPGLTLSIPVRSTRELTLGAISLDLQLPTDYLILHDIVVNSKDGNLSYNLIGDRLLLGWSSLIPLSLQAGETLLTLNFTVKSELPSSVLEQVKAGTECELADEMANVLSKETLSIPKLMVNNNLVAFSVSEPYPNPFTKTCSIPVLVPEQGNVTLIVRNLHGMTVATRNYGTLIKGQQILTFNRNNLAPGTYYAEIICTTPKETLHVIKHLVIM